MAEFNISGRMSVEGLKRQFVNIFGLELRVFKGPVFADNKATLASISDKKVVGFECAGHMKIGNFEQRFEATTGLKVQVATLPTAPKEPGRLINNDFTLSEASRKFGVK